MNIDDAIKAQCDIIKRDVDLLPIYSGKAQVLEIERIQSLMDYLRTMIYEKAQGKTQW